MKCQPKQEVVFITSILQQYLNRKIFQSNFLPDYRGKIVVRQQHYFRQA